MMPRDSKRPALTNTLFLVGLASAATESFAVQTQTAGIKFRGGNGISLRRARAENISGDPGYTAVRRGLDAAGKDSSAGAGFRAFGLAAGRAMDQLPHRGCPANGGRQAEFSGRLPAHSRWQAGPLGPMGHADQASRQPGVSGL